MRIVIKGIVTADDSLSDVIAAVSIGPQHIGRQ